MKLNTKTRYGLRTMLELALNTDRQSGIYQKEIAENQNISNRYLDHIIASLKAAGLVKNVKGKKSGYRLSRKPDEISMYDIYKAFNYDLQIIECITEDGNCPRKPSCSAYEFWKNLNICIADYMVSVKLAEIAGRQQFLNSANDKLTYYI